MPHKSPRVEVGIDYILGCSSGGASNLHDDVGPFLCPLGEGVERAGAVLTLFALELGPRSRELPLHVFLAAHHEGVACAQSAEVSRKSVAMEGA